MRRRPPGGGGSRFDASPACSEDGFRPPPEECGWNSDATGYGAGARLGAFPVALSGESELGVDPLDVFSCEGPANTSGGGGGASATELMKAVVWASSSGAGRVEEGRAHDAAARVLQTYRMSETSVATTGELFGKMKEVYGAEYDVPCGFGFKNDTHFISGAWILAAFVLDGAQMWWWCCLKEQPMGTLFTRAAVFPNYAVTLSFSVLAITITWTCLVEWDDTTLNRLARGVFPVCRVGGCPSGVLCWVLFEID